MVATDSGSPGRRRATYPGISGTGSGSHVAMAGSANSFFAHAAAAEFNKSLRYS